MNSMSGKIRVLIVDDSPLMREALRSVIEKDPSITVIGTAKNGREAVEQTQILKPQVITMDIKMPYMTGLEAIEEIMTENPTPILVVSSLDVRVIIKALGIGAMDFVPITEEIEVISKELIEKIKIASKVRPLRRFSLKNIPSSVPRILGKKDVFKVVAIGVSTGGPQALQEIFRRLPKPLPAGILVVQHMSKGFIDGLAEWLREISAFDIRVAKAGDVLKKGSVLLAPDDFHIQIDSKGYISFCNNTQYSKLHVPSIDVMMESVASSFGPNAIGVILTGMGHDGAEGIKAISKSGGYAIAQDELSSVIFGMNKVAIDSGCIDKVVPLDKIAEELIKLI